MNFYKGDTVEIYWVFVEQRPKDINTSAYHHLGLTFTIYGIDVNGNLIYKYGKKEEDVLIVLPKQVKLVSRSFKNWIAYLWDMFIIKIGFYRQ